MKNVLVFIALICVVNLYAKDTVPNNILYSASATIESSVESSVKSSSESSKSREYTEDDKEIIAFIDVNMDKLKAESATGKGETIDALSDMLYVKSDYLGKILQEDFDDIFSSDTVSAKDVYDKIYKEIN
jgi:hypothetical protein